MKLRQTSFCVTESQEITPSTTFVTIGGNETLICHHPLLPNATVRWFRGGPGSLANNSALLTTHRDARLVQTDSSLFISSFDPLEHAGEYSCIVEPSNEVEQSLVSCPARIKHARKCILIFVCCCCLFVVVIVVCLFLFAFLIRNSIWHPIAW